MKSTHAIIESLVATMLEQASERDKHLFRESLRHLVLLAQSESHAAIRQELDSGMPGTPASCTYH